MSTSSLRKLRKAVKKSPRDAALWYELAVAAIEEAEAAEAEAALRTALALVPPAAVAVAVGRLFQKLGLPAEALRAFHLAAESESGSALAARLYGLALIEAGDLERGLAQLRRAAALLPGDGDSMLLLAQQQLERGRHDEAVATLREAARVAPRHQPTLALLGRCLGARGELTEARVLLERAVEIDPADGASRVELGVVLSKLGDREAGFHCFREVLDRSGDSAEALVKVGLAARAIGDLSAAIRFLRDAVRRKPAMLEAIINLGVLLLEEGSAGAAVVALGRAAELEPSSPVILGHLGDAYSRCGDLEQAKQTLTEAARLAPADAKIQAQLRELQRASLAAMTEPEGIDVDLSDPPDFQGEPTMPRLVSASPKVSESPKAPESPKARISAAMVGSLEDFALPELLQLLRAARRSGVLYLSSGEVSGAVTLLEGDITAASSPAASLGDILMEKYGLSDDDLRKVIGQQREGNPGSIGVSLIERGLIDHEQLKQALEAQIRSAITEILTWTKGRFTFEPRATRPADAPPGPRMDVERVLLDALSA